MHERRDLKSEAELTEFGRDLAGRLRAGDTVLLSGPLGAGKTTLARAILRALGWKGQVRSPTFNLVQTYPTSPPVMHADLYRVESEAGIGLEEFIDSHLCMIEWPDRLTERPNREDRIVTIQLEFAEEGRTLFMDGADGATSTPSG